MNREQWFWLFIGLAWSALTVGFIAAVVVTLGLLGVYWDQDEPDEPDNWEDREARYFEKLGRWAESGLLDRYEIVRPYTDSRNRLYSQRDFEGILDEFALKRRGRSNHWNADRYARYCMELARIRYVDDPEQMRAVLDDWVEHSPDRYEPFLVRGIFHLRYAWYLRGYGRWSSVTQERRDAFIREVELAHIDLKRARESSGNDREPSHHLVRVCRDQELPRDEMEAYFNEVLEVAPYHVEVHRQKLYYLTPLWQGSWEDLDAFIDECVEKSEHHILLRQVEYEAIRVMQSEREGYDAETALDERNCDWAKMYEAAAQKNINWDYYARAAWFAGACGDLSLAAEYFRKLENRFPIDSIWGDLAYFSERKAIAYAYRGLRYTSEFGVQMQQEAIELLPDHYYPRMMYGARQMRDGEYRDAVDTLLTAYSLNHEESDVTFRLAKCYKVLGERHKMVEYAELCLEQGASSAREKELREMLSERINR